MYQGRTAHPADNIFFQLMPIINSNANPTYELIPCENMVGFHQKSMRCWTFAVIPLMCGVNKQGGISVGKMTKMCIKGR